jgi:ActR/RegA family two-component response regulator
MAPSESILLVDDNASYLKTLGALLELEGYRVNQAHSVEAAIECLKQGEYSLVVLDWHLGDQSASELLAQLGQVRPRPRVMILTGLPEDLEIEAADTVISKGDTLRHLFDSIHRLTAA